MSLRTWCQSFGLAAAMIVMPQIAFAQTPAGESVSTAAPAPLDALPTTRLAADLRLLLGVYQHSDGSSVAITGDMGKPRGLAYTFSDGRFGALSENPAGVFSDGEISLKFVAAPTGSLVMTRGTETRSYRKIALIETPTRFNNNGIVLSGKLVQPGAGRAKALAIWIEGSNNNPSTDDSIWQYELARRNIAVFVYDKRGTGSSAGQPSADFHVRASDTAAAIKEARRLAPDIRKIGVIGGSQGGWVAPLVATLVPLDFVIPAFTLAEGPTSQDKALVEQSVLQAGFDAKAMALARQLTAITELIVRTDLQHGFAELEAFKAAHAHEEWIKAIKPNSYTGLFVAFTTEQIKQVGPAAAQGLSFTYEPRPIIESVKARQLWLLGGRDRQAPNAATQKILRDVQHKRRDLAVVIFPDADHGLVQTAADQGASGMSFAPRLFDITADWIIRNKLPGPRRFITMPADGRKKSH